MSEGKQIFWILFGIALIIFAFLSPIIFDKQIETRPSDYELCIRKCPTVKWDNKFENLECPRMCGETVGGYRMNITSRRPVEGKPPYTISFPNQSSESHCNATVLKKNDI